MQLKNYAAWLKEEKAQLKVEAAPFPEAGDDELVIENKAVAINPVDWKIQSNASFKIKYPTILGEDVAGKVIDVGKKLKDKYNVGDRVIAFSNVLVRGTPFGGFQLYPTVQASTASIIPDDMTYNDAVVLPLSISTAAAGLFAEATLKLDYPETHSARSSSRAGNTREPETLLLWGGSSSVGSSVIQLAVAAGYIVVTTASPSNYSYCKALGARLVLDYHNPDIVAILIRVLRGVHVVGAYDAIGTDVTGRQCGAVLHFIGGGKLATVGSAPKIFDNVIVTQIRAGNIAGDEPEVAQKVWGEFVPAALESEELRPFPEPLIVGKGLKHVQDGLDTQKKGVSAKKVVIEL